MRIAYEYDNQRSCHSVEITPDRELIYAYNKPCKFIVPDTELDAFKKAVSLMGYIAHVDVELKS